MLPKKLHIAEIENFHKRMAEVDNQLQAIRDEFGDNITEYSGELKEKAYKLSSEYYQLTKLWIKIDDFIEFTVKHRLYVLKNEPQENWFKE